MTQNQIAYELHKPAKIKFKRRRVIIKGLNDLFQSDLIEMIPYAKQNNGYKYILVVINAYSKYAWAEPLKSKSGKEVACAMEKILKKLKVKPNNFQTDMGKEYYNFNFRALMQKYNINHYSSFSSTKACIAERFIKTLKHLLYRQFSARGSYRWLQLLPSLIKTYNNTVHTTTNLKPSEVSAQTVISKYNYEKKYVKPKYKIGDFVRISKHRKVFNKGYLPQWGTEIFKIYQVQSTFPPTYLLEDMEGCKVKGGFYKEELQKTKFFNTYLIEKIIKKKGNKAYVKWLGFPSSKNSWINISDVV